MTKEELENKQKEMHEKIREYAQKNGLDEEKEPIFDGVADIEGYLSSSPKIMWLLKEPYDLDGYGNWALTGYILNDKDAWKSMDMWKLMIQINFGIRNNLNWDDMDWIENDPKMAEELKKMAYINISKMPGDTASSHTHLWECYNFWKNILFEQIELYKPNVIIFGNTFQFLKKDLQIVENPIHSIPGTRGVDAYKKNDMILIDAFHPSRKGGEEAGHEYVTNIINTYREILKK